VRLVFLEHEADAPAGLLESWAAARGHASVTVAVGRGAALPETSPGEVLVSLGSDRSVARSADSWIGAEIELLRRAAAGGRAVLGICFGGQALARALGGEVERAPSLDPGWSLVETSLPALIPAGPWFRWHEDSFTVPPDAAEIARVDGVPMAFRVDQAYGLQFHPEVTADIALAWVQGARASLADNAIDEHELRRRILAGVNGARERAFDLFDRLAAGWTAAGVL